MGRVGSGGTVGGVGEEDQGSNTLLEGTQFECPNDTCVCSSIAVRTHCGKTAPPSLRPVAASNVIVSKPTPSPHERSVRAAGAFPGDKPSVFPILLTSAGLPDWSSGCCPVSDVRPLPRSPSVTAAHVTQNVSDSGANSNNTPPGRRDLRDAAPLPRCTAGIMPRRNGRVGETECVHCSVQVGHFGHFGVLPVELIHDPHVPQIGESSQQVTSTLFDFDADASPRALVNGFRDSQPRAPRFWGDLRVGSVFSQP